MTAEQLAALKAEVNSVAATAGGIIDAVDPGLVPFVVIGRAVAATAPDLVNDVEKWIESIKSGKDPTDEENAVLSDKIASLMHPETL